MRKRLMSIIFAAAVMLSLSAVFAFAGSESSFKEVKVSESQKAAIENRLRQSKPAYVEDDMDEDWIYITEPEKEIITGYKGEKLKVVFNCNDTWEDYKTVPAIVVITIDGDYVTSYVYDKADAVTTDSWSQYSFECDLSSSLVSAGNDYYICCLAAPDTGDEIMDLVAGDEFNIPMDAVRLNLRALGRPSKVSLSAGKKKVTVSWSSVTGAYKYQVYRSTSKSKGYTRVATTSSRKFVDKKVKKGKRYYYKVRAVRYKNKTVYGSYTSPKRSGKVR